MQTKIRPGRPYPLGATWDGQGTNFSLYSEHATSVELCLFDARDPTQEHSRVRLPERTAHVWHVYIPEISPGQLYGYRVYGPFEPERGLRFNAAKLLQKVGRTDDAIVHFRKVVEIEPAFGTGHLYLAQALLERGDLDGAEQWARTGLENHPEPRLAPLGHYVLADVYEQRGRFAEARREVAAAERLKQARPTVTSPDEPR